jgi:hypothetical protein
MSRTGWASEPSDLPATTLWGLGKSWSGRRTRSGTWDRESRWLSYGLVHYRGKYDDPSKPRLAVVHELKVETDQRRSLEAAAVQALTTFVSDNKPLRLSDDEYRKWLRELLGQQARESSLGPEWEEHQLILDAAPVPARIKEMPNGYCLVADTPSSYLAVSARHYTRDLNLTQQPDVSQVYKPG